MRIFFCVMSLSGLLLTSMGAGPTYFKIEKQIHRDCFFDYANTHGKLPFGHGAILIKHKPGDKTLELRCNHHGRQMCTITPQVDATYTILKRHHRGDLFVCDSRRAATKNCQLCQTK